MFDVFYSGTAPGLFAHERQADSIEHARSMSRTRFFWWVTYLCDYSHFDFLWEPSPWQAHQRHAWSSQWQQDSGTYLVPTVGYADTNYHSDLIIPRLADLSTWRIPKYIDTQSFDFSWHPDFREPSYEYHFGTQWQSAGGPVYIGSAGIKLVNEPRAYALENRANWSILDHVDSTSIDYSWHPNPLDPPYIYHFPSQWQSVSGVTYTVTNASEIKLIDPFVVKALPQYTNWSIPEEVNASTVDYSWHPNPLDPPYIYHFGTEYQHSIDLTYTVDGATEIKFAGEIPVTSAVQNSTEAIAVLDIFYLDRSNAVSASRFARLQERYPHIQRVRYVNSVMDTIKRCLNKTKNSRFWVIGSENVYDDFDFAWHPEPWQRSMTHVFGSQWNKWSDTFLINKWEFERNTRWARGIEEFPNLNFVQDQQVVAPADAAPVYVLDHGNADWKYLQDCCRVVRSARYFDNYLDSLRRLLTGVEEEHIWVVSSLCDYTRFDFSWQPEAWQRNMLHVFPSNDQKFGDTFYVPVGALRDKIDSLELLDWFETVNYCNDQRVERLPMPVFTHTADSHVDAVLSSNFVEPLALFTNRSVDVRKLPTVSLWREKTKTIVPLDASAGAVIVPKSAISYIKTQLYDYPYIDKTHRNTLTVKPQDIVFISYDEPDAETNWALLKAQFPRAQRVHGVAGMELALEAAADLSSTPWYYAVFAKTRLYEQFDFSFVPDYMQQPKHYIFNCRNTTNGLEYGHMGIVLYNCSGVKQVNQAGNFGLDYTLSFPHESIPILSCYGDFAITPYHTWRTAFRETAKLAYFESQTPTVEGAYRLNRWLDQAQGNHAEWCLNGARDGLEFFETTQGDLAKLKQSFRWEWLRSYFEQRYGDLK
jgi:hypothetical protein